MPSRRFVRSPRAASAKDTPAIARKRPATGLPSGQRMREDDRQRVAAALQRKQGRQPECHADREREPAGEEQGGGGHPEPDRPPARALGAEVTAGERLEERGAGSAASASATGGPRSQAIGGEMMLYAGVW